MDYTTFSRRAGRYFNLLVVINLVAIVFLATAIGWAIISPENQRLWIIDIGVIGAVAIWLAGTIWRVVYANKASH